MTTQQTPPPQSTWGAPLPEQERPRKPWSTRKIVVSAVIAVVIVAGGTAAVVAETGTASSTTGQGGFGPGGGQGGPGGTGFGGGRGGFGATGLTNALHGDFVVANGSNGYTTERLQTGTVTAVSASDITIKSTDGYTQSYTIGSSTTVDRGQDTIAKVVKGNEVTVIATLSGQTATTTSIEDTTIDTGGQFNSGQGGPGGTGAGSGGSGNGGPPAN